MSDRRFGSSIVGDEPRSWSSYGLTDAMFEQEKVWVLG